MDTRTAALVALLIMSSWPNLVMADIDCSTVTSLISTCSNYGRHGFPKPTSGSPCCNALESLHNIASEPDDRRSVCRCFMGLMSVYNMDATAMAALPSLCQVSLGFSMDLRTNCNLIP